MRSKPRVTCAIIFLDEEAFLGEAIDSVLAQTFSDWELLLVDDGSSDSSATLAQEFADREPDQGVHRGRVVCRHLHLGKCRGLQHRNPHGGRRAASARTRAFVHRAGVDRRRPIRVVGQHHHGRCADRDPMGLR